MKSDAGSDASGGAAGSGGSSQGGTGGWNLKDGASDSPAIETCDGLDNDQDGKVDDGCTCTAGATQKCYPEGSTPTEGCKWGTQTCQGSDWGNAKCVGATLPADGEPACCTALGATPKHTVYDVFVAAYPSTAMPKSVAEMNAFDPQAGGYKMKWAQVVVGNELIDAKNGGVIQANIEAGRKVSRTEAEKTMPAGAKVVDVEEGPVTIEQIGTDPPGYGVGWAWGSILYQTTDDAVGELVYMYVGLLHEGDIEKFFYSEEPVQVCKPPKTPR